MAVGMAAWTHVDELYQAYLTAYLAMESLGVPAKPRQSICNLEDAKAVRHRSVART